MSHPIPGRTVVFRGTEPAELQLVEGRLELEGLQPLRLGRVHAPLAGGGNSAFEQLITVPNHHVAAAQALLDPACVDEVELERQALAADPIDLGQVLGGLGRPEQIAADRGEAGPLGIGPKLVPALFSAR